jgi:Cu2+-exporting ATPase
MDTAGVWNGGIRVRRRTACPLTMRWPWPPPSNAIRSSRLRRESSHAQERKLTIPPVRDFAAIPGKAIVDGREMFIGGPALLRSLGLQVPEHLRQAAADADGRGQASIYLADNHAALAAFAVADVIRPESIEAVSLLHQRGVEMVMMTGDARAVADSVAAELGIDVVFAEVLPDQKASKSRI